MEPASHARIDPVTVDGLEDVFSSGAPNQEFDVQTPGRPFQSATSLLHNLRVAAQLQKEAHLQDSSTAEKSEGEQSAQRALVAATAIARCLDVRSEAVIEHHTITKPKSKKSGSKKKVVEEWRIKWSPKDDDSRPASAVAALPDLDGSDRGLFEHISELLRQNAVLVAKLEGATYRIGYLEAELECLRNQAGFADCDAQVAELPVARPAIRAISESRKPNSPGNAPDSKFSNSPDFWDEEPILQDAQVPSQKNVEEPPAVAIVKRLVGEMLGKELNAPLPTRLNEVQSVKQSADTSINSSSVENSGVFNWLPPRA